MCEDLCELYQCMAVWRSSIRTLRSRRLPRLVTSSSPRRQHTEAASEGTERQRWFAPSLGGLATTTTTLLLSPLSHCCLLPVPAAG